MLDTSPANVLLVEILNRYNFYRTTAKIERKKHEFIRFYEFIKQHSDLLAEIKDNVCCAQSQKCKADDAKKANAISITNSTENYNDCSRYGHDSIALKDGDRKSKPPGKIHKSKHEPKE